ncbi:ATP-binding cassette domain-containing protein [Sphingobium chungbukense]|uniref:Molybdenum ABC transporter ATP-binding protein n=1 Tax=Sphingobium chungbukense TaxID=56193 RepID=A0A0M3AX17_9SPHN|nr:ATP-binding cassette domain-containing protein [Sphingobium chungbukense]KKW93144.1 molybdenum ABC transporter ATP-binding protein [Sphingobium chungbukense]
MSFDIDLDHRIGDRRIMLQCRSDAGLVALYAPSGAGKTSILNMVAGIITPDQGRIAVAGETLFDSEAGIDLPPERRRAGYIFQDGRLFPHMRVRANLLYGHHGEPPMPFESVLGFLGIGHLLDRWPATLSGGEAQRVAIGRALLSGPNFLLMDEPLSSLDPSRREDILSVIERMKHDLAMPILYVSHDRAEVERLADRIIPL